MAGAETMCAHRGQEIGAPAEDVLVCSTGLIGTRLPIEGIEAAIPGLAAGRSATRPRPSPRPRRS
jgi:glutamate N-acetyltransferase/amino-acid N-acetyltransferase